MTIMQFNGPGFMMEVPSDWLIMSSPEHQAVFLGPENTDGLRPNLLVAIRPNNETVTPTLIAQKTRENQEHEYTNYRVLNEVDYAENGGEGFRREYSWFNEENQQEIYQIQAFFTLSNALFTLTATYFAIDDSSIAESLSQMVDSFRFSVRNVS